MDKNIDLILVNPGSHEEVYGELASSLRAIEPPIWCALLAAYIREYGFFVEILDADAKLFSPKKTAEKIIHKNPLLTAVIVNGSNPSASSTPKMVAAGLILKELHLTAPDLTTIIAGLHPSALPKRTLDEESTNFVCQGEGFITILELLKFLKNKRKYKINDIKGLWYRQNNRIQSNPPAPLIENLSTIPFAAWDLLPMDRYRAHNWHCFDDIDKRKPYAAIYTSLGCPFNCTYCNINTLYNNKPGLRFRSPDTVVNEISYLVNEYNVKNIKIIDELFVWKKKRVNEICDRIIALGLDLNIWAYARIDTIEKEMLSKMKKAGINWLAIGFESANKQVRQGVKKNFSNDKVDNIIELVRSSGIYIIGNFIFGLPNDNFSTMRETIDMAKNYNFEYANFYAAMAYPGSQLYLDALKKEIKLPDSWLGFSQYSKESMPLPTNYLSSSEVLEFRDKAFYEYFTNPSYLKMIETKFGKKVIAHIEDMLKHKIVRDKIELIQ